MFVDESEARPNSANDSRRIFGFFFFHTRFVSNSVGLNKNSFLFFFFTLINIKTRSSLLETRDFFRFKSLTLTRHLKKVLYNSRFTRHFVIQFALTLLKFIRSVGVLIYMELRMYPRNLMMYVHRVRVRDTVSVNISRKNCFSHVNFRVFA